MLTLTSASLAKVKELFRYKAAGFDLPPFPGYTSDQWGIKAHNRPWIVDVGRFEAGHRAVEIGGGYSLLMEYLAESKGVESWLVDDFGINSGEDFWARWGRPHEYAAQHPRVNYVFERVRCTGGVLPERSFDRIISVSTLEHLPEDQRIGVLREIHQYLAPGGVELHTIDIPVRRPVRTLLAGLIERIVPTWLPWGSAASEIRKWIACISASGVAVGSRLPSSWEMLDRATLAESPDVVYRFYPPNDAPKAYRPSASLLLVVEDI